jgi:hypothetical protein
MSAFAVKVSSDKQTLILKGEAIPPRRAVGRDADASGTEISVQLQRVAMPLAPRDFAANGPVGPDQRALPQAAGAGGTLGISARSLVPYSLSNRGLRAGAAEYVRTQNMSGDDLRSQLIDTYA